MSETEKGFTEGEEKIDEDIFEIQYTKEDINPGNKTIYYDKQNTIGKVSKFEYIVKRLAKEMQFEIPIVYVLLYAIGF